MKSQLATLLFVILVNTGGFFYYKKVHVDSEKNIQFVDDIYLCLQEISDKLRTTPRCESFLTQGQAKEINEEKFILLEKSFSEYKKAAVGEKGLIRAELKEKLSYFSEQAQERKDYLYGRQNYFETLFYLFNGMIVVCYLYLSLRFLGKKALAQSRLTPAQKLFFHLIEKNFPQQKKIYSSIGFLHEKTALTDEFLGTLFFSLIKLNDKLIQKYGDVEYIKIEAHEEKEFIKFTQFCEFKELQQESLGFIKDQIDFKLLMGLAEEQDGHIQVFLEEQKQQLIMEIYLNLEQMPPPLNA